MTMTTSEPDNPVDRITVLGAGCGLGGGHQGTAHGPNAARAAALIDHLASIGPVLDLGDLEEPTSSGRRNIIADWITSLRVRTREIVEQGSMPLVLGGDHSIAAGSMAGACSAWREKHGTAPGLLWIDAHVDLNTHDTTPSGNPHGMPAASLLGWQVDSFSELVGADGLFDRSRMAFVGARDIDPGEQAHLDEGGIAVWSSQDVMERGVEEVMRDALAVVSPNHEPFCLSFDIDVVDPRFAPGVDTAVPDGLSPAEAMECMARAGQHAPIVSMDLVELNPEHDVDGRTAHIAVACVSAALEAARTSASHSER